MDISQSGGPGGHWHCWSYHPLSFIMDIKEDVSIWPKDLLINKQTDALTDSLIG